MERAERARAYANYLAEEGYRPTIDQDGDVVFKIEGFMYYIAIDEDEEFFRLVFPTFWPLESAEERERAERIALRVTDRMKVAKVLTTERGVVASLEMFVPGPESVFPVFPRCVQAIRGAVHAFTEAMRAGAPS